MKARVKLTGEIIEVERLTNTTYGRLDVAQIYRKDMLDFDLPEPEEEVTIEGWVCKDEYDDGFARIHTEEPYPGHEELLPDSLELIEVWKSNGNVYLISDEIFPDLKHTDTPKKVTITIKPKKK